MGQWVNRDERRISPLEYLVLRGREGQVFGIREVIIFIFRFCEKETEKVEEY